MQHLPDRSSISVFLTRWRGLIYVVLLSLAIALAFMSKALRLY